MSLITALVAVGPNSVQQICMLFDNMDQGLEYIETHLGDKVRIRPRKYLDREGMWVSPKAELEETLEQGSSEVNPEIAAFWTSYYGGCGWVGAFFLAEFPTAAPILRWDLD